MMLVLSGMSTREKKIWAELLIDIVVACFYFPQIIQLILSVDTGPEGIAVIGLTIRTIFLAIFLAIVANIILYFISEPEQEDERDVMFLMKGSVVALWCLVACILFIIGQTYLAMIFPFLEEHRGIKLTPVVIVHLLLGAVILSMSIKSLVQIFLYRRGY